jgi:putative oxidoreductase
MIAVPALYHRIAAFLSRLADAGLPLAARFVFAAVLFGYFWASGLTKIGDGVFSPSVGAYAQIFPRVFEAAGYDASQMSGWQTMVVLAGTLAEFVLPILIVTGLFTRLAALGMVGFVVVQSLTDIVGHKAGPGVLGAVPADPDREGRGRAIGGPGADGDVPVSRPSWMTRPPAPAATGGRAA